MIEFQLESQQLPHVLVVLFVIKAVPSPANTCGTASIFLVLNLPEVRQELSIAGSQNVERTTLVVFPWVDCGTNKGLE